MQNPETLRATIEAAAGMGSTAAVAPAESDVETPEEAEAREIKEVQHWASEIELGEKFIREWREKAGDAVDAYLSENDTGFPAATNHRLNLFHANVSTLMSMLAGNTPKVEADRRFADPTDDIGRVASEIVTRILQNDLNDPDDTYVTVLRQSLQDRLLAGLGVARVRYAMEEGQDELGQPAKIDEWCEIDYHHWRDIVWSPCRTPYELRWKAFRVYMDKAEATARFGAEKAALLNYGLRSTAHETETGVDELFKSNKQAEIFEIWDKKSETVRWYSKGQSRFLDVQKDPVGFDGFWCDPPWMCANLTTKKYVPKPDYEVSRDLYEEINVLEHRIAMLTRACKVVGVYPASAKEIARVLTEASENQMIPVEAWAMFAERGGLKGQIEYFPIKEVAETLQVLSAQQAARIQQLYEVSGMSDILRGNTDPNETLGAQKIKAQFASTRIQFLQNDFAEFATGLMNKKVTLIRKYYDAERIKQLSNIMATPDADKADAAIALIKDAPAFRCRVVIRAESLAQIDYEALKQERATFMQAVAQFLGSAGPILGQMPDAAPFLMEMLKFQLAGMKGANQMEGVIDAAVAAMIEGQKKKAAEPPQPSPEETKLQAEMKMKEAEFGLAQQKAQQDLQLKQQEAQLKAGQSQQELQIEVQKAQLALEQMREEHKLEMAKLIMELKAMKAKMALDAQKAQLDAAAKQDQHEMAMEQAADKHEQQESMAQESHEKELDRSPEEE